MREAGATANREPAPDAAPEHAAALSVELTGELALELADADALERILADRPETAVFVSPAWLSGFFADPPDGVQPLLAILRQGRVLRGVMPIAIRRTLTQTHVAPLGGSCGSDRVDLVTARGFEAAGADAFVQWLRDAFGSAGFVLELRDVPATSALWGAVYRASAEGTFRGALVPRELSTLPYLDLREPPTISLAAAPAAAALRSLEKHRRWLERRCRLRIDLLDDPGEVMKAFDSLVGFLHARWRGAAEGSALDDSRRRRFHAVVLPRMLQAGSLRMIRVSADIDRTIAVFYGMASGAWWGYYLCGYDREWAGRIHLGQVTLGAAIGLAGREGAGEFDFLKGAHRIKYAWPVKERATLDADLFSDRPGPQLTRAYRAVRDAAAALTKSARHCFSTP
jgi:CelD/BcsL family acetyltransferase involved in cellulose biosynthesis